MRAGGHREPWTVAEGGVVASRVTVGSSDSVFEITATTMGQRTLQMEFMMRLTLPARHCVQPQPGVGNSGQWDFSERSCSCSLPIQRQANSFALCPEREMSHICSSCCLGVWVNLEFCRNSKESGIAVWQGRGELRGEQQYLVCVHFSLSVYLPVSERLAEESRRKKKLYFPGPQRAIHAYDDSTCLQQTLSYQSFP